MSRPSLPSPSWRRCLSWLCLNGCHVLRPTDNNGSFDNNEALQCGLLRQSWTWCSGITLNLMCCHIFFQLDRKMEFQSSCFCLLVCLLHVLPMYIHIKTLHHLTDAYKCDVNVTFIYVSFQTILCMMSLCMVYPWHHGIKKCLIDV